MFVDTLKIRMKYRKIQMDCNSNNITIIAIAIIVHIIFVFFN